MGSEAGGALEFGEVKAGFQLVAHDVPASADAEVVILHFGKLRIQSARTDSVYVGMKLLLHPACRMLSAKKKKIQQLGLSVNLSCTCCIRLAELRF